MSLERRLRLAIENCGYRNIREVWHKATDEKPANSGEYLGLFHYEGGSVYLQLINFYEITGAFNRDLGDDESLEIFPDYWCEISDILPV